MILKNKNILLISPEPWNHIFVSKHHYATYLGERDNKVYFINPPSHKKAIKETNFKNVWEVDYKKFPRGMRFYPNILQKYFIKRKFKELEKFCQTRFDIVWSFDNSVFYDFSSIPKKVLKISHIVDLNQDFHTAKAAKTADVCFGVSSPILNRQKVYNDNAFFINHGCYHYSGEGKMFLPGNNKIKAFYAGNLDIPYIDWRLFLNLVAENNEVDFILAGPWAEGKSKKQALLFPNVYYVGRLKSDELKRYYEAADILLLVYNAEEYKEQLANPHKMMEYLASGKMIVATFTAEYESLERGKLIAMCLENRDFPALFKEVLVDLNTWNDEKKQLARKAFAFDNTYEKQIDTIEKYLELNSESNVVGRAN